ncbi:MAG TPA: CBS domain-containing protein [Bryobacteraceae bacterium]|nr:CBS domain-containing protein [Bryobacteraceae bacterium]
MVQTIASILNEKGDAVWSVTPESTVYEAIAVMADKSIGAVLVVRGEELVGILSERDYARKVILQGKSSKRTRVAEIMTTSLITVPPEATVDGCMRMMTHHRVRHLPVVDGRRGVVGVLSIGDLVKAVIADQAETIEQLNSYIGSRYPA